MSLGPCPFRNRCDFAEPTCTEERSNSCDVIHNITPPPPKRWNPQEPVAVTMTREQWQTVSAYLAFGVDMQHCRMIWCRDFIADKSLAAEKAADHERQMHKLETMLRIVEETLAAPTEEVTL